MDSQAWGGELADISFKTYALKSLMVTLALKAGQNTANHQDPWQVLWVIFFSHHHLKSLVESVLCETWGETQVEYRKRISALGYQLGIQSIIVFIHYFPYFISREGCVSAVSTSNTWMLLLLCLDCCFFFLFCGLHFSVFMKNRTF